MNGRLYLASDGNYRVTRVRTLPNGARLAEQITVMDRHEVHAHLTDHEAIAHARAVERGLIDKEHTA